ncbi:DNA-binding transcriptional LysR family regulator [Novosphingobium sp. PhB55]|uniref:LysR family transcriptional regulator n=1 Tax=unclassified Novosphingobium TaxID=2644732 RepID=UPI001065B7D5|nr:LysR family transcriptional regulator [Novosphingobium sp. PhB55]TDW64373.1 DNA-binding transcriptional LysR family regulator [Novosphingobium sp. PhB55]
MEMRRLSYFVRVAEDASLTRAAGVLNIAQSALSRQMRLLEEELGVALFARTPRGMRLTSEGAQLRTAVAGPLRELELAIQNMRALPSQIDGNVALGLTPGIADLIARPLAEELHATFPRVRFRLSEGPTGSLEDWLRRGMIDLAVLEQPSQSEQLVVDPLADLPFCLFGASAASELGSQAPDTLLSPDAAFAFPLIVPSHHMGMRPAIDDAAMRTRVQPRIAFEADCTRLIKDLALSGMGHALLPLAYIGAQDGNMRVQRIDDPLFTLRISLCTRKDSQIFGSKRAMIDAAIARILRERLALV